jgi:hypothetical protein
MSTLSLACYFAGINYHVTHVCPLTLKHKWQPSLTTLLESPKKIGHIVILAPVAKASFVNKKMTTSIEVSLMQALMAASWAGCLQGLRPREFR